MNEQTIYQVNDIYSCIQGEGALTGVPMTMIRMQGCPVGCPFCDTKETWEAAKEFEVSTLDAALGTSPHWAKANAGEIMRVVDQLRARDIVESPTEVSFMRAAARAPGRRWVLISGGEPCMQNLGALTALAKERMLRCALETSGTAPISGEWDWLTISPKIGMPGGRSLLKEAISMADEIKFVIGRAEDLTKLDELLSLGWHHQLCEISLQPMSASPKATALCIAACQAFDWRLSIQTHKIVGIR